MLDAPRSWVGKAAGFFFLAVRIDHGRQSFQGLNRVQIKIFASKRDHLAKRQQDKKSRDKEFRIRGPGDITPDFFFFFCHFFPFRRTTQKQAKFSRQVGGE